MKQETEARTGRESTRTSMARGGPSSRISGFFKRSIEERAKLVAGFAGMDRTSLEWALAQGGLNVFRHDRRKDKKPPHPVDDAWNRGQQFDCPAHNLAHPRRRQFHEEQRDHQTERHRQQHRDARGNQRPKDAASRAKLLSYGVPRLRDEEPRSESSERKAGIADEFHADPGRDDEDRSAASRGHPSEGKIRLPLPPGTTPRAGGSRSPGVSQRCGILLRHWAAPPVSATPADRWRRSVPARYPRRVQRRSGE